MRTPPRTPTPAAPRKTHPLRARVLATALLAAPMPQGCTRYRRVTGPTTAFQSAFSGIGTIQRAQSRAMRFDQALSPTGPTQGGALPRLAPAAASGPGQRDSRNTGQNTGLHTEKGNDPSPDTAAEEDTNGVLLGPAAGLVDTFATEPTVSIVLAGTPNPQAAEAILDGLLQLDGVIAGIVQDGGASVRLCLERSDPPSARDLLTTAKNNGADVQAVEFKAGR